MKELPVTEERKLAPFTVEEEEAIVAKLNTIAKRQDNTVDDDLGKVVDRAYVVVSFTAYEQGMACGAAMMGETRPDLSSEDPIKCAKAILDCGAHSIAARTMMDLLDEVPILTKVTEKTERIMIGAKIASQEFTA